MTGFVPNVLNHWSLNTNFLTLVSISIIAGSISIFFGLMFGNSMRTLVMAVPNQRNVYSMAFVTVPNIEVAKNLSKGLVEKKLAACVNILPSITSIYEWEGKIEEDNELLLMIKTRSSRVDEISSFVRENHPYDVAEVISSTIENGNAPYLKWIGETVPDN